MKTSNFKLAYSAEAGLAAKAGQTSDKLQGSNIKDSNFGVWCLNFADEGNLDG